MQRAIEAPRGLPAFGADVVEVYGSLVRRRAPDLVPAG
jgi:hypothetical protein